MNTILLGVGDLGVSNRQEALIKSYALGTCVAFVCWCRETGTAGMVHAALPDSSINGDKSRKKPGYFVDTGLPALLEEMENEGADKRALTIKLVGGANMLDPTDIFDIGRRNIEAARNAVRKHSLSLAAQDVGGNLSRTVTVSAATGEVMISSAGTKKWNL
jgi:chemotaxis protein CheD